MLKISEVANQLGVSRETVRRWILNGQLKGWHAGPRGAYRVHQDDLDRFTSQGQPPA